MPCFLLSFRCSKFIAFTLSLLALLSVAPGCSMFRARSDTVARLDKPRERPHKPIDRRTRQMVIAITTDPAGQIVDIQFRKASGSAAVDDYVRESIKASWPGQGQPGSVTTVELTYSTEGGFSEPKVLETHPVP
ncbi:MAG: TonB C-terminal domain-containing protein [Verrucomicrobia bacterium]|nr:TonB C-terminal domain-containing protein [Verrucomicrobiota bacterium]MBV9659207.1 TonB C-terminal domain-containing protein [Verrucomicrobiota bacterium]